MQQAELEDDPTVETILTFNGKVQPHKMSGKGWSLPLVRRRDRHDDGSWSTTYYLELSHEQYRKLGGE